MDFYLSDGSRRLLFPLNPQQVTATTAARMVTYQSIALGEFSLPRGSIPTRFSWDGIFPGALRKDSVAVKSWRDPKAIAGLLSSWRDKGQKLKLLITETPINHDVYIQSFDHTWLGGHGDAQYTIELVQAKIIKIGVVEGTTKKEVQISSAKGGRSSPPSPKTYTVKKGDTLWGIAKRFLKSGSRHNEIYNIPENKKLIGPDPNKIKPGQILRLPS